MIPPRIRNLLAAIDRDGQAPPDMTEDEVEYMVYMGLVEESSGQLTEKGKQALSSSPSGRAMSITTHVFTDEDFPEVDLR